MVAMDDWDGRPGGLFAPTRGLASWVMDMLIAAAMGFVQIVGTIIYSHDEPSARSLDVVAFVLLSVGPAALLFRRRWPEGTLIGAFAAAAAYAATGYPPGPAGLPAVTGTLVNTIMMGRRGFAWRALAVFFPAFVWLPTLMAEPVRQTSGWAGRAVNLAWLPLFGTASELARTHVERRAEHARGLQEEARRRASEERLLIASELHDVLAHNISLINVQSGVALHLLDGQADQARTALEAINEASNEALEGLRSVLDVVSRGPGGIQVRAEPERWAPRAPTAGVRDLDDLVRRTQAAGPDVRLVVRGAAAPLPIGVDLAVYRIVQESLTNVLRHVGTDTQATVRLTYAPAELEVQVDDDGGGGRPGDASAVGSGTGSGIAGMHERVRALDGTFTSGVSPDGGFRVRARFPLQDRTR